MAQSRDAWPWVLAGGLGLGALWLLWPRQAAAGATVGAGLTAEQQRALLALTQGRPAAPAESGGLLQDIQQTVGLVAAVPGVVKALTSAASTVTGAVTSAGGAAASGTASTAGGALTSLAGASVSGATLAAEAGASLGIAPTALVETSAMLGPIGPAAAVPEAAAAAAGGAGATGIATIPGLGLLGTAAVAAAPLLVGGVLALTMPHESDEETSKKLFSHYQQEGDAYLRRVVDFWVRYPDGGNYGTANLWEKYVIPWIRQTGRYVGPGDWFYEGYWAWRRANEQRLTDFLSQDMSR